MNRSIQVEGAFGVIKEDYGFRRFLTRGKPKTETQFFLISFAHNIKKYFNKAKGERLKKEYLKIIDVLQKKLHISKGIGEIGLRFINKIENVSNIGLFNIQLSIIFLVKNWKTITNQQWSYELV